MKKNFEVFEKSINEAANQISWSSEYSFQDREFIEDEMVYQRAWYDDHYVLIRSYRDKTWSKSFISHFWTDSNALTFAGGIKVGSSLDDLKAFFGRKHVFQNTRYIHSNIYSVYQLEEDSDAHRGILFFSVRNNTITSIAFYFMGAHTTSKMRFLFDLYSSLLFAEVKGERVNVREGYSRRDKVMFQVSQSKGDCLLIDGEEQPDNWCYIRARIINNSLRPLPSCYISRQFLKIRNLTQSEKKRYVAQYLKK